MARLSRLISRFELTIDGKGRLVLPSSHRPRYSDGAILSPRGTHIAVYEPEEWDRFIAQLTEYRVSGEIDRETFNWITINAADPTPDSAGRILIPGWMREEVGLGQQVLVGGAHDYLAIYPADYVTTVDPEIPRQAAIKMNTLGL